MFGVVFPERSYPMDISSFTQIDPLHYLLDISTFLPPSSSPDYSSYTQLKEMCIFLLTPSSLPPSKALSVYIQPPSHPDFLFCGAIHSSRPSALLSLPWPHPTDPSTVSAKIGVSVEDVTALPPKAVDAGLERRIERMAMKVGENLFNFMQSFCGVDGSRLVVPMDILNRWFKKFQERARRDPEYLKGFAAV